MEQNTLVLIKPDAIKRHMAGLIITAIENLGLCIEHLCQKILSEDEARALYAEHAGKWHFPRNIRHITSGPSIAIHVSGKEAVLKCRQVIETIRSAHKDLINLPANLVHATSSPEKAYDELKAVGLSCNIKAIPKSSAKEMAVA